MLVCLCVCISFSLVLRYCCLSVMQKQRPQTPVVSLLDKVRGKTDAEKEEQKREDGEVLANSILNHQTNSIRQARTELWQAGVGCEMLFWSMCFLHLWHAHVLLRTTTAANYASRHHYLHRQQWQQKCHVGKRVINVTIGHNFYLPTRNDNLTRWLQMYTSIPPGGNLRNSHHHGQERG